MATFYHTIRILCVVCIHLLVTICPTTGGLIVNNSLTIGGNKMTGEVADRSLNLEPTMPNAEANDGEVTVEQSVHSIAEKLKLLRKLHSWASHIKEHIQQINCRSRPRWFSTLRRCESIKRTPFEDMTIYIAPPKRNVVFSAILPDGDLEDSTQHHSIVVVDPFPGVNFGHVVLVFYIDGSTRPWCERNNHRYLGSHLCLIAAKRSRCWNNGRFASLNRQQIHKCEVNFIPLVVDHFRPVSERGKEQQLMCMSNLAGFGTCPEKLSVTSEVDERCELRENTKECYLRKENQEQRRKLPPCRLYQICDYAVSIFGGWNSITMRQQNEDNIRTMYKMFRKNGFLQEKIQIFYNGNGDLKLEDGYNSGLPASDKSAIRHHISTLCHTNLCVDSLIIYLNGPSSSDGKLLLWDKNGDGLADEEEVYTPWEIISDVTGCAANQIVLMVDQSYSGVITAELKSARKRTNQLDNVVLIASGDSSEYSWDDGVTSHWSKHSVMRSISWGIDGLGFVGSTASIVNRKLADEFTLYGAPVERGFPRFSVELSRLRKTYMGCQNLPTSSWKISFLNNINTGGVEENSDT